MTSAIDRNTRYIRTYRRAILRSLFDRAVDLIPKPYMGKMGVNPFIFKADPVDLIDRFRIDSPIFNILGFEICRFQEVVF